MTDRALFRRPGRSTDGRGYQANRRCSDAGCARASVRRTPRDRCRHTPRRSTVHRCPGRVPFQYESGRWRSTIVTDYRRRRQLGCGVAQAMRPTAGRRAARASRAFFSFHGEVVLHPEPRAAMQGTLFRPLSLTGPRGETVYATMARTRRTQTCILPIWLLPVTVRASFPIGGAHTHRARESGRGEDGLSIRDFARRDRIYTPPPVSRPTCPPQSHTSSGALDSGQSTPESRPAQHRLLQTHSFIFSLVTPQAQSAALGS